MAERLLFIHGFGCDSRFWKPQIEAFNVGSYEVVAPDLPFHGGRRPHPPGPPLPSGEGGAAATVAEVEKSLEGLARWVVEEYGDRPSVLIGHSLGGMIALQVVRERPELVRGIVLVDSFPSIEQNLATLPEMFVSPPDDQVRRWIEATREGIIGRMTRAVYDEIWPSVGAFDARPWLADIECPVLGVYGGRGRYGEGDAERLKRELELDRVAGGAEVVIVPEAGHFVGLERPEAVNEAVWGWLATTSDPPSPLPS